MLKKLKKILSPKWGFDFKISIDKHIVSLEQGKQISIPVILESSRGESQDISLNVNTKWESVGLTAKVIPSKLNPSQQWKATMMIRASVSTPPGSYLFTVRGSTKETFRTSEDAVTVNVIPRNKKNGEKQDEPEDQADFQLGQPNNIPSSNFDLDKLFAPIPKSTLKTVPPKIAAGGFGWGLVIIIFFIIIGITMAVTLKDTPVSKSTNKNSSSGCPNLSGCGTIAPQCRCPANCPKYFIITSAYLKGYKQCHN
jgi:hypothetical protein